MEKIPKSEIYNSCSLEAMRLMPDNAFKLAIVDPPYGIEAKISKGGGSHTKSKSKFHQRYAENGKSWDRQKPLTDYWIQLFRVSENQIIFGGNYFINELPISRCWIYWDKQGGNMSSVSDELVWTSFDKKMKIFSRCHGLDKGFMADHNAFHPTWKPVALYEWVLKNYAKAGDNILDTHLGSGSSRIAAYKLGFDFTGYEIDKEYFDESDARFKKAIAMPLFDIPVTPSVIKNELFQTY